MLCHMSCYVVVVVKCTLQTLKLNLKKCENGLEVQLYSKEEAASSPPSLESVIVSNVTAWREKS